MIATVWIPDNQEKRSVKENPYSQSMQFQEHVTTCLMPSNNNIPKSSEGVELAVCSYTPIQIGSKLRVTYAVTWNRDCICNLALFLGLEPAAFYARFCPSCGMMDSFEFMEVKTLEKVTVKLRGGPTGDGVARFSPAQIKIEEIPPRS